MQKGFQSVPRRQPLFMATRHCKLDIACTFHSLLMRSQILVKFKFAAKIEVSLSYELRYYLKLTFIFKLTVI